MEKAIDKIEKYFTDNIEIDVDYLKEFSSRHIDILDLKVFYIYGLYKTNQLKLANDELVFFNQFRELENNSFFLMVKSLVEINQNIELDLLIKSLEINLKNDKLKKNKWLRIELFNLYKKKQIDYLAWGYLEEAISIDPNFWEAILKRAYGLSLIENCYDIVNQILQFPLTYLNADILNFLGNAYLNCNNIENALKIFKGSLEIEITEEAYYFIGFINHYHLKDYEKALYYYDKSISINNEFSDALFEKSWLFYDMGRLESSETLFNEIIADYDEINSYNQITLFYIKTRKYVEALNYIEKAKSKFGNNHMNEGFELVCLEKLKDSKYISKYYLYKENYTVEELSWFKTLLEEI